MMDQQHKPRLSKGLLQCQWASCASLTLIVIAATGVLFVACNTPLAAILLDHRSTAESGMDESTTLGFLQFCPAVVCAGNGLHPQLFLRRWLRKLPG